LKKLSQSEKVVEFLRENSNQKFNARQIAEAIVEAHPADYKENAKTQDLPMKRHLSLKLLLKLVRKKIK